MHKTFSRQRGPFQATLSIQPLGDDLQVVLWGGDRPHVGAVAVAEPRVSRTDPVRTTASSSVICLSGHKEDELARDAALRLAIVSKGAVAVTAGLHWDQLDADDIKDVLGLCDELIRDAENWLATRDEEGKG